MQKLVSSFTLVVMHALFALIFKFKSFFIYFSSWKQTCQTLLYINFVEAIHGLHHLKCNFVIRTC
jgi:hypothetical protein